MSGRITVEHTARSTYLAVRPYPSGHASYQQVNNDIRRVLPGSRWVTSLKAIGVPIGPGSGSPSPFLLAGIKTLVQKWGFSLETTDEMKQYLVAWERLEKQISVIPRSIDGELVVPGIKGKLVPAQVDGVLYLVDRKRAILGDDVGSGKSVQAFTSLVLTNAFPAVCVTTQTMKVQLSHELQKWFPEKSTCILSSRPKPEKLRAAAAWWIEFKRRNSNWRELAGLDKGEQYFFDASAINSFSVKSPEKVVQPFAAIETADMTLVNYDIVAAWSPLLKVIGFRGLVCDESHRLRGSTSQRTKALINMSANIPIRYMLTGTPVVNRPIELLPQLQILGRIDDLGGAVYYKIRYCQGVPGQMDQWNGARRLDELRDRLTKVCMINRPWQMFRKADEPRVQLLPVMIDNESEYRRAEADIAGWFVEHVQNGNVDAWLKNQMRRYPQQAKALANAPRARQLDAFLNAAENRILRMEALQRIIHLRNVVAKGKISTAAEFIDDIVESGRKIVVFAIHKEVQALLYKALAHHGPSTIFAEQNSESRGEHIAAFQEDPSRMVMLASLGAGGEGVTLTAAADVLFVELAWTPMEMIQGLGRVNRHGQTKPVNGYWMSGEMGTGKSASPTIDRYMYDLLTAKSDVISKIMGNKIELVTEKLESGSGIGFIASKFLQ